MWAMSSVASASATTSPSARARSAAVRRSVSAASHSAASRRVRPWRSRIANCSSGRAIWSARPYSAIAVAVSYGASVSAGSHERAEPDRGGQPAEVGAARMVGDRRRTGGDLGRVRGLDELSFEVFEHPLVQGSAPLRLDGRVRRLLPRAVRERRLVPDPVDFDPGVELRRQGVDRFGLAGEDLLDQSRVEASALGEDGGDAERPVGGEWPRLEPPTERRHDRRSAPSVGSRIPRRRTR